MGGIARTWLIDRPFAGNALASREGFEIVVFPYIALIGAVAWLDVALRLVGG